MCMITNTQVRCQRRLALVIVHVFRHAFSAFSTDCMAREKFMLHCQRKTYSIRGNNSKIRITTYEIRMARNYGHACVLSA